MKVRHALPQGLQLRSLPGLIVMVLVLMMFLVSCGDSTELPPPDQGNNQSRDAGYRVLKKLLEDEKHLKTLRIVKDVITLGETSRPSVTLIEDIAGTSSRSLEEMDELIKLEPGIMLDKAGPTQLGGKILDALRKSTAKDLITASGDDFEVSLIISQAQVLRLISQLLKELSQLEPNTTRQAWLVDLADRYEDFYQRAVARLVIK